MVDPDTLKTDTQARSSAIRVYASGAPRVALQRLAPEFERETGRALALSFDGVAPLRARLAAGEKTDVILLPATMLAEMDAKGALRAASRAALARVGIGIAVRKGASVPDISSPDAVRAALLAARSIAYSDPKLAPSGVHLERVLAQLGIADDARPKTTLRTPFDGGVELVASGRVEVGIYLVSEIRMVEGVALAGLLPRQLQSYLVFAGAVAADSPVPEAALAFLEFLRAPAGRDRWEAAGFEPTEGSG